MRKLPIILTLLLAALWAYTCWYWYTCNIKGFCDKQEKYTNTQITKQFSGDTDADEIETTSSLQTTNLSTDTSPILSAKDVLLDPLPKEVEETETDVAEVSDEVTQTGSIVEVTQSGSVDESTEDNTQSSTGSIKNPTICENPIVGPIVLGGDNKKQEVEYLEIFLISRGEDLNIDRIYGNDDFEAMKKFQLEYKSEVLDPWGITTPTGYVGKTSIAKINELSCK